MDLNQLKALEVLLDERHISRAAERTHVTQSAMSRTLARLRVSFDDELLVRTPEGYVLTPHARVLQEQLTSVMHDLRNIIEGTTFDPATASKVIHLAAFDYAVAVLGDRLFPSFTREAPNMSLIITPLTPTLFTDISHGQIELVLTPFDIPHHFERRTLFTDDFVCVMAEDHPLTAGRLTIEDLAAYSHASVGGMNTQQMLVIGQLRRLGANLMPEVRVPFFSAAIAAVRETNLITVLPRRFAQQHADPSLRIAEAPPEIIGIRYLMAWHPRFTGDPSHRWLRELLIRVAESMDAGEQARSARRPDESEQLA